MGYVDDDGVWYAFPPPPEWEPCPIALSEWIHVWDGNRWKRRKAVPDPYPLFPTLNEVDQ